MTDDRQPIDGPLDPASADGDDGFELESASLAQDAELTA